jgi:cytochrome c5
VTGREVYINYCRGCHQTGGQGVPGRFPPLRAAQWVAGNPQVPIRIVLDGLRGPLTVQGQWFNGEMPAFRNQLSDRQIAALISYLRSWQSNAGTAIDVRVVREVRAATAGRRIPWTAEELGGGYPAWLWICAAAVLIGGILIAAASAARRRGGRARG